MLTLAFGKGETDFPAVGLVLFINIGDKGLEVLSRLISLNILRGFFGFVRQGHVLLI